MTSLADNPVLLSGRYSPHPTLPYLIGVDGSCFSLKTRKLVGTDSGKGYLIVRSGGKNYGVHVLVCETYHGPKPAPNYQAAHGDGKPGNNRPDNLRWATPKDNNHDKIAHGTVQDQTGELGPRAILKESQVIDILLRWQKGERSADLARAFGVTKATVNLITDGTNWSALHAKYVTDTSQVVRDCYKLTAEQEQEILDLLAAGHYQKKVAQMYGVSQGTISNINIRGARS